jgi:hypothetical protein
MNTIIDVNKLETYRKELFKEMNDLNNTKDLTPEEDEVRAKIWNYGFTSGMFAGINIVLYNSDFQSEDTVNRIDINKVKIHRDQLYKKMNEILPLNLSKEEEKIKEKLFDHIFITGQYVGVCSI